MLGDPVEIGYGFANIPDKPRIDAWPAGDESPETFCGEEASAWGCDDGDGRAASGDLDLFAGGDAVQDVVEISGGGGRAKAGHVPSLIR